MTLWGRYFPAKRLAIIGMVHVRALPGTPGCPVGGSSNRVDLLVRTAVEEASTYVKHGLHGILLENMFDRPYLNGQVGPEITATMARICTEVRRQVPQHIPCGVQILAAANQEAMAVAAASDLQFIRAECFVFGHVADEGLMATASAGPLLRYRRQIDAEQVAILADIKKKHSAHAITADVDLIGAAKAAEFFLTDAVIVTGSETGQAPSVDEHLVPLKPVLNDTAVVVGSGITDHHLAKLIRGSPVDGAIVGSHFKRNGKWFNELDEERIGKFMENYHRCYAV